MKSDTIKFEILEDGTISLTTDQVSGPNHVSADQLLRELAELVGGEVKISKRNKFHVHANLHDHNAMKAHAADGHTH